MQFSLIGLFSLLIPKRSIAIQILIIPQGYNESVCLKKRNIFTYFKTETIFRY